MTTSPEGAAEIITRVDQLRAELDALRPLSPEAEARALQKLRLDWNYHSNAIEGNSLTYGETMAFLMHGVTAKGKPFKDYLDIRGHNAAIKFILEIIRGETPLTEKDIRDLHALVLVEPYEIDAITPDGTSVRRMVHLGAYKTSPNHVRTATGEVHYFASPEQTPIEMGELMRWFAASEGVEHPLVRASVLHHRLVAIHPFDDGNGRVARLLMNLVLMRAGFPPAVLRNERRAEYYAALARADAGEIGPLVELVGEAVARSIDVYVRAARGESIDEPDDLDKEIALLRQEIESRRGSGGVHLSEESRDFFVERVVSPIVAQMDAKLAKIASLFERAEWRVAFDGMSLVGDCRDAFIPALSKPATSCALQSVEFSRLRNARHSLSVALRIQVRLEEMQARIRSWVEPLEATHERRDAARHRALQRHDAPLELRLSYLQELPAERRDDFVQRAIRTLLDLIRHEDEASGPA
ncbi:MAG: Fic family protein [Myxococcales bacterium]|nr:Fic family protein [Myxococcales bacterium]